MQPEVAEGLHQIITRDAGINFIAQLPDSQTHRLHELLHEDQQTTLISVTSEGEGAAVCAGAWMGGKHPALLIADAGLLVATWSLASVAVSFGIPMLLLVAHRGQIGDRNDWRFSRYKHTTEPLLHTLQIPYTFCSNLAEAAKEIPGAKLSSWMWQQPVAVLMQGDLLAD